MIEIGLIIAAFGLISWGMFNLLDVQDLSNEGFGEIEHEIEADVVHDTTTVEGRTKKAKEIVTVIKARLRPEDVGFFEMYKDQAEEFRFRLFDAQGNNILMSEGYKRKANCIKGINSVKKNAIDSSKFSFGKSKDDKDYFTLRATNGRILGRSQFYTNITEALEAVDLIIVQAVNNAKVNDLT